MKTVSLPCLAFLLLGRLASASSSTRSEDTIRVQDEAPPYEISQLASETNVDLRTVQDDIDTIYARRLGTIINGVTGLNNVKKWLATLDADGKWPDSEVNYATQCAAQRANWPAQTHWQRILTMSAAFRGGGNFEVSRSRAYVADDELREAIGRAMNWWFARDFQNVDCEDAGGQALCPCTDPPTPATWLFNTNWYSNVILIPGLVSKTCLILNGTLSETQTGNCTNISRRSYHNFVRVSPVFGANWLTGANTLDVANIGIDSAVVARNVTQLADAYGRIHREMTIVQETTADGIRPDGSFGQHLGLLYNGNYGKDFVNVVLALEYASGGTQFQAPASAKAAFDVLIDGDRWMVFRNTIDKILHWDFSAIPRFISFPTADNQASANLKVNLTDFKVLGQLWDDETLLSFERDLNGGDKTTANAGNVVGNRMFYANDYMVHRGKEYHSSLKMFSTRTKNTECTNTQNPFGFHLSDGAVYTWICGDEYENITASWDWNLIPGTTTDDANTPLTCAQAEWKGLQNFVGGASDGVVGVSAMRYINPLTRQFAFQKAWFFLEEDVQHVVVSNITSQTAARVVSVLDQRRVNGPVSVDNVSISGETHLWHGGVGYRIPTKGQTFNLVQRVRQNVTGDWSRIGTSKQPPTSVDLFTAFIEHNSLNESLEYTAYPVTNLEDSFPRKLKQLKLFSVRTDSSTTAIYDQTHATAFIVFWNPSGGSATFDQPGVQSPFVLSSKTSATVIYKQWSGNITVADPSQALSRVEVTLEMKKAWPAKRTFVYALPRGGEAGKSVTQNVYAPLE